MRLKLTTLIAFTIPIWLMSTTQALACPVSGTVYGARSVIVRLINPNNGNFLMEANATPGYYFSSIPSGRYLLRVYNRSGRRISTNPSQLEVYCRGGFPIEGQNFHIN